MELQFMGDQQAADSKKKHFLASGRGLEKPVIRDVFFPPMSWMICKSTCGKQENVNLIKLKLHCPHSAPK
jgi:hypothetical protein